MYLEISNPMDYHVALYIRLSKEDENEGPSQSVTNQKSLLNEFIQQHRLSVYDTYIDDGWSGTSFDRPDFQRMIGDIEAKKVNMVITKDLSRLGRDYIMTGHYMERYFPEKRVRYISLLDGIDTGVESTANDITPFRAIMNDMYAKDISKKIKSVKRDKQRKGQFIGRKPMYGYKMHPTEKNKIVIDEEMAPIVRRIFAMTLDGMSCRKIAATLNEEGVPTPATYCGWNMGRKGPYAGLWSSERISEMLQNETYLGNMVQGRTVKISYKVSKTKQPGIVYNTMLFDNPGGYQNGDILTEGIAGCNVSVYQKKYNKDTGRLTDQVLVSESYYAKRDAVVVQIYVEPAPEPEPEPEPSTDPSTDPSTEPSTDTQPETGGATETTTPESTPSTEAPSVTTPESNTP